MALRRVSSAAVLLWLLAAALSPAVMAQGNWQLDLTDQMLRDHDCEVSFLSQVTEREVNGDRIVLAKVHCVDKRSFDVYRDSMFEPFEIKLCEQPDARAC